MRASAMGVRLAYRLRRQLNACGVCTAYCSHCIRHRHRRCLHPTSMRQCPWTISIRRWLGPGARQSGSQNAKRDPFLDRIITYGFPGVIVRCLRQMLLWTTNSCCARTRARRPCSFATMWTTTTSSSASSTPFSPVCTAKKGQPRCARPLLSTRWLSVLIRVVSLQDGCHWSLRASPKLLRRYCSNQISVPEEITSRRVAEMRDAVHRGYNCSGGTLLLRRCIAPRSRLSPQGIDLVERFEYGCSKC
mmetsp:Transcript_29277/g.75446  ORF Transcript_29277/g.75446 Transcript_29277/m.75446 type:complete len:247 (+) Transcript_29277:207-947(+)